MAVLLPPILRSRFDGGGVSSVSDFRRQLNTLQRTQGPMGAPHAMRAMSRPLAPSPRSGPNRAMPTRANPNRPMPNRAASNRAATNRGPSENAPTRGYQRPRLVATNGMIEQEPRHRRTHHTAEIARQDPSSGYITSRDVVRRRRVNVLYGLIAANLLSLFLGLTTGSSMMVYAFTVAILALGAYCYILVQIRNQEYLRRYYGQRHAA